MRNRNGLEWKVGKKQIHLIIHRIVIKLTSRNLRLTSSVIDSLVKSIQPLLFDINDHFLFHYIQFI